MAAERVYGRIAALIPAAGGGHRMGGVTPKQFLKLGGREILARTLDVFEACLLIDEIWVVVAAEQRDVCQEEIVARYGFQKVKGVITGGPTRQDSVWRGLQCISAACRLVVVHDGVRPLLTDYLLQETLHTASQYGAAIAAVPLKDTLKRVSAAGEVEMTVPREHLWRVQTPQAFQAAILRQAFRHAQQQGFVATDEAGLVELLGYPVMIVQSFEHNMKITTPDDLAFCEAYLHSQR